MLVFERTIAGVIRYRRVFFPRYDQLIELVKDLRASDVVRVFSAPAIYSNKVRPIVRSER